MHQKSTYLCAINFKVLFGTNLVALPWGKTIYSPSSGRAKTDRRHRAAAVPVILFAIRLLDHRLGLHLFEGLRVWGGWFRCVVYFGGFRAWV